VESQSEDRLPYLQVCLFLRQLLSGASSYEPKLIRNRVRKVKCDETRPSCFRCIATGRVCDGYGIWGGGGSCSSQPPTLTVCRKSKLISHSFLPPTVSLLTTTAEEKSCFEWFRLRTSEKLPASYASNFWSTLLFQASVTEPAVLNAVLALGAVHKIGILKPGAEEASGTKAEQFILQHYGKAITCLQPHFSREDRTSSRTALITCIIFVCFEFLRGHFQTGQVHLKNGLKILRNIGFIQEESSSLQPKMSRDIAEEWIVEIFSRLSLQVELFRPGYLGSWLPFGVTNQTPRRLIFCSRNHAWKELEWLLSRIFHLAQQVPESAAEVKSLKQPPELFASQQDIESSLTQWLKKYDEFLLANPVKCRTGENKAHKMIRTYHTMATIMCATAIQPDFELQSDKFLLLISQLEAIWTASVPASLSQEFMQLRARKFRNIDMASSIIDMGWIPPLYYTAINCRIRKIKWQAIHLMECLAHREGIWDSKVAARVARKVIEIEERDFHNGVGEAVHFVSGFLDLDSFRGVEEPVLSDDYRLRDIEVVLEGSPMARILLFCKRKEDGTYRRVLVSEYNVSSESWTDQGS
jgi:hypothetical protein